MLLTWHLSGFIRMSKRLFCWSLRKPLWLNVFAEIKPSLLFVFVFSAVMLLFVDWVSLLFLWLFFEMMLLLLLLLLFTEIGLETFSMLSTINGGLTLSWDGSIVLDELLFGEKRDGCDMVECVLGSIDSEIGLRGGKAGIGCDNTFGTITFDWMGMKLNLHEKFSKRFLVKIGTSSRSNFHCFAHFIHVDFKKLRNS